MDRNNEPVKVIDAVVGLLMFLVLLSCIIVLIGFAQNKQAKYIKHMRETTESAKMSRITELSMTTDDILCTAVANVLTEFGEDELAFVVIVAEGSTDIYYNDGITITYNGSYNSHSSLTPIEEAIKMLLKYSERRCAVSTVETDEGFPYIVIQVN